MENYMESVLTRLRCPSLYRPWSVIGKKSQPLTMKQSRSRHEGLGLVMEESDRRTEVSIGRNNAEDMMW